MRNAILKETGRDGTHRRATVLAACFLAVFAIAVTAPNFTDLATGGTVVLAKGKGKGKGLESAPGQAGRHEDDVADVGEPVDSSPPVSDQASAEIGGEPTESPIDEIPGESPPAHITVIKELVGLPDNSALSEQEEMDAIRNGWGTWRTADGPDTILAQ